MLDRLGPLKMIVMIECMARPRGVTGTLQAPPPPPPPPTHTPTLNPAVALRNRVGLGLACSHCL
jgi:hypothetical protein